MWVSVDGSDTPAREKDAEAPGVFLSSIRSIAHFLPNQIQRFDNYLSITVDSEVVYLID
jgi:hypothetical protein